MYFEHIRAHYNNDTGLFRNGFVEGGLLAWQRKLRYRQRCELYTYEKADIDKLFAPLGFARVEVGRIARDFFVTAWAC